MTQMKKFCINVKSSEGKQVKLSIRVKNEDIRLLSLALSDSTCVVGFWQE